MGAFKQKVIKLLAEAQKVHALSLLNNVPVGVNLEVVIREATKKRNNDQNSLYRHVVSQISDQVWVNKRQYEPDLWHIYFKNLFLPDEISEPYIHELVTKPETYKKWKYLPNDKQELVGSTTELTTYGFSQFMEKVYVFASEHHVIFEVNGVDYE